MRTYLKSLGIIVFVIVLLAAIAFILAVLDAHFSYSNPLIYVCIFAALIIFMFLNYLSITRLGFYVEPESRKQPFLMKYTPFTILFIMLFAICYEFITDIVKSERNKVNNETKTSHNREFIGYERRKEIMTDTIFSLCDKLKKFNLGEKRTSDLFSIHYIINNGPNALVNINKESSLSNYYKEFKISSGLIEKLKRANYQIVSDSIIMKLNNGREVYMRTDEEYKLKGYLELQNLFILEKTNDRNSYEYQSINAIDGTAFPSIPAFSNENRELYADIHFTQTEPEVNLEIKFWYRDESSTYILLQAETIPLDFYFNKFRQLCEVNNVSWTKDTFNFEIQTGKTHIKNIAHVEVVFTPTW